MLRRYQEYTPFLSKYQTFTSKDHPGILSVVYYINPLICNLDCYNCHNKKEIRDCLKRRDYDCLKTLTLHEFLHQVSEYQKLGSELLIITGGEPLLSDVVLNFLKKHRSLISLPIRIDTNGSLPDKMLEFQDYVDGFGLDIKIPIKHEYNQQEIENIRKLLGSQHMDVAEYRDKIRKSYDICKTMRFSHVRLGYAYYCIQFGTNESTLKLLCGSS